jgi:hypothetical protein
MPSLRRMFRLARATAHSSCGWIAYRCGWHGTARRHFERVLLFRGADFRAYVHLGRIAFEHGDYSGWRRELEHARRTDPVRFARLRHPIELFEPRLAGTQFEGRHELDGYQAADSRATWRALHPFRQPFGPDSGHHDDMQRPDSLPKGLDGGRMPDGFGRNTDLPLAPGYDPMIPGQQLDDCDPDYLHDRLHDDLQNGGLLGNTRSDRQGSHDDAPTSGSTSSDKNIYPPDDAFYISGSNPPGSNPPGSNPTGSTPTGNITPGGNPPGWSAPDAAMSRDDFSSPIERRRFQLRRPIDRQEIARCDLNELARRLSS